MTIDPEHIAILITIIMPSIVLSAAALNTIWHERKGK